MDKQNSGAAGHVGGQSHDKKMYLRFGAMILTAMVVMYAVMFVSSWQWSHIRFSESRVFMALTMGGTMGLIMLGYMLNMYRNTKANLASSRRACSCWPPACSSTAARPPCRTAGG